MRYYFHTADGTRERDTEGTELPDLAAARRKAVIYASDCMRDDPEILSDRDFRIEVTDQTDLLLFTVIAFAINAPATRQT